MGDVVSCGARVCGEPEKPEEAACHALPTMGSTKDDTSKATVMRIEVRLGRFFIDPLDPLAAPKIFLDVEGTDTVEAVKAKIQDKKAPLQISSASPSSASSSMTAAPSTTTR